MKSYSKIRRLGHSRNTDTIRNPEDNLIFKEKFDGSNLRFTVEDGELRFGSKNVEYQTEDDIDPRFEDAINAVKSKVDPSDLEEHLTYFCENMVKHTLEYNWVKTPQVIGFDIYHHKEDRYLPCTQAYQIFSRLQIYTAPIVDRKTVEEFEPQEYEVPDSRFRDGKMEGVVIINTSQDEDNRSGFSTRAKYRTEEFKEKHKKGTGARQSVEAIKGHEKIVSKYCTDARIRKHINKMRDTGRDLGKELMGNKDDSPGLPVRVATDILEEEASEIVSRNDEMNWKNYRSLVADRCLRVIEEEMQARAGGRINR
jgi:hypothetical protein